MVWGIEASGRWNRFYLEGDFTGWSEQIDRFFLAKMTDEQKDYWDVWAIEGTTRLLRATVSGSREIPAEILPRAFDINYYKHDLPNWI